MPKHDMTSEITRIAKSGLPAHLHPAEASPWNNSPRPEIRQIEESSGPAATPPVPAVNSLAPAAKSDKRNLTLLEGVDGRKRAVPIETAARFGGVTRRAIERAIKKGKLDAEGSGVNRRVLVESLLKYFPG